MSANNEIYVKFLSDISDLKKDVGTIKKEMKGVGNEVGGLGGKFAKFGLTMGGIDRAISMIIGPLGKMVGQFRTAASDVEEMDSKFKVVFGKNSQAVDEWAGNYGDKVGRAKSEIKGMLSTIQDTFVPMGYQRDKAAELSKEMASLAIDVASFNNAQDADVLRDFQSAIVGNHETVRKYGIVITEDTLKQEAYASGITEVGKQLTNMEKVQARVNIITKGSVDAHGDAERTLGSNANTLKSLRAEWQEYAEDMGADILPLITDFFEFLRDDVIPILASATKKVTNFFLSMTETSLETTIREMKELGMETLEYELIIARMNETTATANALGLDEELTKKRAERVDIRRKELYKDLWAEQKKLNDLGYDEKQLRDEIRAIQIDTKGEMDVASLVAKKGLLENVDLLNGELRILEDENEELLDQTKSIHKKKAAILEVQAIEKAIADSKKAIKDEDPTEDPTPTGLPTLPQLSDMAKEAQALVDQFNNDLYESNTDAEQQEIDRLTAHHQDIMDAISFHFEDVLEGWDEQQKAEELFYDKKKEINDKWQKYRDDQAKREQMKDAYYMQLKLSIYSNTLSALSDLLGQSKKGQIASARLAQLSAIVDTYAGATKALTQPFGMVKMVGIIAAGLANVIQIQKAISSMKTAATGADFITRGPQLMMVGENPGGRERVQVTPLSSPNTNGPQGSGGDTINYIFSGNVMTDDFVRSVEQKIEKRKRLNLS